MYIPRLARFCGYNAKTLRNNYMRKFFRIIALLLISSTLLAQTRDPYQIKGKVDWPVTLSSTALAVYGFYQIANVSGADSSEIAKLNYTDVPGVDRWVSPEYSEAANKSSDYIFFGSMALPLGLLSLSEIRSDAATIGLMYWQAMAITGALYTNVSSNVKRFRPLVYSNDAPFNEKTRANAKLSFFAGHPAVVATSTFFIAKVLSDYYPERRGLKWIAYSSASALTLTTAYLRHRAGKHFITGLATGIAVGALTGILVPELHKKRDNKKALTVRPFGGSVSGIVLTYKIK